jgi:polysaccharide biosynthesis transport protein
MPQEDAFPEPGPRPNDRSEPPAVAGRIEAAPRESYPQAPALSSAPSIGDLLRALRRRWMTALALGGTLAAIAAIAVWYLMTPDYTAFAQIRVLSGQPVVDPANADRSGSQSSFMTYLRSQATQYKSHQVIQAALQRDEVKKLNLEANYTNPMFYIDEKLKVEILDGSEFMTPRMTGPDQNEVSTIIKAMTAAYMSVIVYAEDKTRRASHAQLEKAYNEAVAHLDEKKASLEKNAKGYDTTSDASLTQTQVTLLENLRNAKQDRYQMRSELFKNESMLEAHTAQMKKLKETQLSDAQIETAIKADPEASRLKERLEKCREIVQHYLDNAREPEKEPSYRAALKLKADIEQQYARRRAEVKAEVQARFDEKLLEDHDLTGPTLRATIARLKPNLATLEQDIKELSDKVEKFPSHITELESQRAEIRRLELVADALGVQKEKLRIELDAPPRIIATQEAEMEKRDMKKQIAATAVAPVAVFFLSCMSVAWLEYRQRRIHSAGEVAHGLGIRVVGSIPNHPNLERCFASSASEADLPAQPTVESIDAIRTMLLYQAQTASTRVVMVTSAADGEGKTTLASHLASSLARAGRKTLLVDADLRQPAVHQLFETPLQPGFSEVLLGEVEIADSIQSTTVDGLSIVPAGQWDREVIQSLARGGMEGVFEKLREEFDFIIVDSHPILTATDALLIGQHADAVLLSVRKQVSQMPRVYTACQRLADLNIRVLGAVVSGIDPDEVFTAPSYAMAGEQA